MLTRRTLLARFLLAPAGWHLLKQTAPAAAPATAASLKPIDRLMDEIVREHGIVGATLAVAKDGRLVLANGYGMEDKEAGQPVRPDTLFCIASETKSITAVATLKLVDEGRLDLDARLVDVLGDLKPLPGHKIADPRFRDITVHHLLYHAGGFPGAGVGEEADDGANASKGTQAYRMALSQTLEFTPGTDHRYSNFGYIILRLVVERASGQPYEEYAKRTILAPMGIVRMHLEGPRRGPGETQRYNPAGRPIREWNGVNWVATASDMVRFLSRVAGSGGPPFLSRKLTARMLELPPGIQAGPRGAHVGLGWDAVRATPRAFGSARTAASPASRPGSSTSRATSTGPSCSTPAIARASRQTR